MKPRSLLYDLEKPGLLRSHGNCTHASLKKCDGYSSLGNMRYGLNLMNLLFIRPQMRQELASYHAISCLFSGRLVSSNGKG